MTGVWQQEQRVSIIRKLVAVLWVAVVLAANSYKQHQLDCLEQTSLLSET